MSRKLRAKTEDELQVLFTCPAARQERMQQCKSESDYLSKLCNQPGVLGTFDVGDHFEQHVQLTSAPDLFGKGSRLLSQRSCAQALLRSLFISSNKLAGFSQLTQHRSHNSHSQLGLAGFNSPLVVLLRRVSIWYHYHVMYSTAEVLLLITSGCELLFQLLTPHQQLSIMSEVLITLSSPSMALSKSDGRNAELLDALDTPIHTATFMSMLYMAKQLAVTEAAEQQQQQVHGASQTPYSPFTALHPTALLQLRLARLQRYADDHSQQQQQPQQQQPVSLTGSSAAVTAASAKSYEVLKHEAYNQQVHKMLPVVLQHPRPNLAREALVQQQQVLGPLLSDVSKLSQPQLELWQHIQQYAAAAAATGTGPGDQQGFPADMHAAAVTAAALQQLKQASGATGALQDFDSVIPLSEMLLQFLQKQQLVQQQQQDGQQQLEEMLHMSHVVSVLLHEVMYQHALDLSKMNLEPYLATCQLQLLLSLHSRIATLLLSTQQHLSTHAQCRLGTPRSVAEGHNSSQQSSSSSNKNTIVDESCALIMQQVQAAMLQFVRVRQASTPQVVYLSLEGKLKDVLRRPQQPSWQSPNYAQSGFNMQQQHQQQQQQQEQQCSDVSSSSGTASAATDDSDSSWLQQLFCVLHFLFFSLILKQRTFDHPQAQQDMSKIATILNVRSSEACGRVSACLDQIQASNLGCMHDTYTRLVKFVGDSGVLEWQQEMKQTVLNLQPIVQKCLPVPASQDAARVAMLYCCVYIVFTLNELCKDESAPQHPIFMQVLQQSAEICQPISPTLLAAGKCLLRPAATQQQQHDEAPAAMYQQAVPGAGSGEHSGSGAASQPEEGPMRMAGGMGYCSDDSSSSSSSSGDRSEHQTDDAQARHESSQAAVDDSGNCSGGEIGQDVFHDALQQHGERDSNDHQNRWQQQQQDSHPDSEDAWRQLAEESWQQQQQQQEEEEEEEEAGTLLTSESPGCLSDSSDSTNWRQQQQLHRQPKWQWLPYPQLRRLRFHRYWSHGALSLNSRSAWVDFLVQTCINSESGHRLVSLARRVNQLDTSAHSISSNSGSVSSSSQADSADYADDDSPTFPDLAMAMDHLLMPGQYDGTELQHEGLHLLQKAYNHVFDRIDDCKEDAEELRRELQRQVAEPLEELIRVQQDEEYEELRDRIKYFGVDDLPLLVKEWLHQLVVLGGALMPSPGGLNPATDEHMLQEWEDSHPIYAHNWLDRAEKFLGGVRLMLRLHVMCSKELKSLKGTNEDLSEFLEALPEFPITPPAAAAAAAAAAAYEGLPDDDMMYSLVQELAKQQQIVKASADALKAGPHHVAVAFNGEVSLCTWEVLRKMLCLIVHAEIKGEEWSEISREASDQMTTIVTLMLCHLHNTTSNLDLPDGFKLHHFRQAAATLSSDTVQLLFDHFKARGGLPAFYWLLEQLPGNPADEVTRRAFGRKWVPHSIKVTSTSKAGRYVYHSQMDRFSERGLSWDGYEERDAFGPGWEGLPTISELRSSDVMTGPVQEARQQLEALKQCQEELATAVAAAGGSAATDELVQECNELQQVSAAVARVCLQALLCPPEVADAASDDESDSSSDSGTMPLGRGSTGHAMSSTSAAAAEHGGSSSRGLIDDIAAACRFAKLQSEHAVAKRLLGLQQQLASVSEQEELQSQPEEHLMSDTTAAVQQQLAVIHTRGGMGSCLLKSDLDSDVRHHPALVLQQYGSCCMKRITKSNAYEQHKEWYQAELDQMILLQHGITAAHNSMQRQLLADGTLFAAAAAKDATKLPEPYSSNTSIDNSSDLDQDLLDLGVHCAQTAAAAACDTGSSNSYRTLLWQVLMQLKPSVQSWYHQLIQKHNKQQKNAGSSSGRSSSSSSANTPVVVPDQAIPELWELVGSSIAADILVIPPAFRDLLQNDWAGGAGRMTNSSSRNGGSSSSSDGSSSAAAARMLVVQYARAVRKKAAKAYNPQQLIMQLLLLQLLAVDDDKLAELGPAAAAPVAASLAAATHAAQIGAQPLLAAVVEAHSGNISSGSSSVGIHQLAAQYGVTAAPPFLALPWLQFLTSYHALHSAMATNRDLLQTTCIRRSVARDARGGGGDDHINDDHDGVDRGPGFCPQFEPETSLAAAAAVMMSYPCSGHPRLLLWLKNEMEKYGLDKVPAVPTSWLPEAIQIPQQQQQQQQRRQRQRDCTKAHGVNSPPTSQKKQKDQTASKEQQQQQQGDAGSGVDVRDPLLSMSYWLHADRLMSVPPDAWQRYLLSSSSSSSSSSAGSSSSSSAGSSSNSSNTAMQKQLELLADVCCDWCGQRMPTAAAAGGGGGAAAGGGGGSSSLSKWCCAGCRSTQYCSAVCATAAKKVHLNNCWRIAALAADGRYWQQQRPGDEQSRAFFDYCTNKAPLDDCKMKGS